MLMPAGCIVILGSGTLCASWQCLEAPRGPPPSLAVQFVGSGASLSGMELELVGSRYRMSLVKKRFATGETGICSASVGVYIVTLRENVALKRPEPERTLESR